MNNATFSVNNRTQVSCNRLCRERAASTRLAYRAVFRAVSQDLEGKKDRNVCGRKYEVFPATVILHENGRGFLRKATRGHSDSLFFIINHPRGKLLQEMSVFNDEIFIAWKLTP